jgi:hypothetical protein
VTAVASAAATRVVAIGATVVALGWERTVIVLAVIASVTYLTGLGKLDPTALVAVLASVLGYLFGRSHPQSMRVSAGQTIQTDTSTTETNTAPGAKG